MAHLEYWLQIENQPWDLAPNGLDRVTGAQFTRDGNGLFRPLGEQALIIRKYTANWAAPDDRPLNVWDLNEPNPAQTHGTIPGALLEAKVGDDIVVHFRNMDQRPGASAAERTHSLYMHGVNHAALYDGTYPLAPPDPKQGNKQGDRVAPGETFDYFYTVPHASNAGAWFYHDRSQAHPTSLLLGAFGVLVVRGGGESKAPPLGQPLRGPNDSPLHFANVPPPVGAVEHVLVFHELKGAGECLNGRQLLGNTPTLLARQNVRVKFRVLNLTPRDQAFHVNGRRWAWGNDWVDVLSVPSGGGLTLEWLEGTAESGGGNGEWLVQSQSSYDVCGSLVVTDGGALALSSGMTPAAAQPTALSGEPDAGRAH